MSADVLREAAKVLRERAEAATPGPWKRFGMAGVAGPEWEVVDERRVECEGCAEPVALTGCTTHAEASYIATMHPGVGLALAPLLDTLAHHVASHDCEAHCEPDGCDPVLRALNVARAVLGEARA